MGLFIENAIKPYVKGWPRTSTLPFQVWYVVPPVLIGAVNSLFAAAWLDSAKDPASSLWPNQRHRLALAETFSGRNTPAADSDLYHAVFSDATKDNSVKGWSFLARWKRANIIKENT